MKLIINTDGGARGNPGPAGIGVVIQNSTGEILKEYKEYIGNATNNVAEYKALILAFEKCLNDLNLQPEISVLQIRMDSELIVRQMLGEYKIKEPTLKVLAAEVINLKSKFKSVSFEHVRREFNKEADKLVNQAIDAATV